MVPISSITDRDLKTETKHSFHFTYEDYFSTHHIYVNTKHQYKLYALQFTDIMSQLPVYENVTLSKKQSPLEKLRVTNIVKKFPIFYENRKFITMFITACHCSLFCHNQIYNLVPCFLKICANNEMSVLLGYDTALHPIRTDTSSTPL